MGSCSKRYNDREYGRSHDELPQTPNWLNFHPGRVVVPADNLVGVQAEDGRLVPLERLGPGLVEQVAPDGRVGVRWLTAEFVAWMDPTDCALAETMHI